MTGLSYLFVCTFGNYLAPILIAAHTANNLDFGDKPDRPAAQHEKIMKANEDYESEEP